MNLILTALLILTLILLAIDWQQTLVIARNPHRWYERNVILGEHPSTSRVNFYFGFCALAALLLWALAPAWLALSAYLVTCIVQVVCIGNNYRHGIRF